MTLNIRCNHVERSIPVRWTGAVIRPFSLVQLADFFLLITNKKWLIVIVYFSFWVGDLFVMSLFYLFATVINLPGYMIRKRNKKKRNSLMLKSQGSRIPHSRANYIVCNNQGTVCSVLRQRCKNWVRTGQVPVMTLSTKKHENELHQQQRWMIFTRLEEDLVHQSEDQW